MSEDCELLFFDTFSHENCEELNLDLVQFPNPVYIVEIRVIPLGARVQADFPGGHRLGATNPSSFKLEFFVNDLSTNAATFENLGCLDYKQNVDIQFINNNKAPTDGMVIRGWYSAVTLAIYGIVSKTPIIETDSPPPPPQINARQPSLEHALSKDYNSPIADVVGGDWERNARMVSAPPEPPPIRAHPPVEPPPYIDVPPMIHPQPDHASYPQEIIGGYNEPPPAMVYQDCGPQGLPVAPPYGQYDPHYPKPWPPPEEQYQPQGEPYEHQMYNRPPDPNLYQPPPDNNRPLWDPKTHQRPPEHEHEGYGRPPHHDMPPLHRDKDMPPKDRRGDRMWDRDIHEDDRSREHDSKLKDRGRRSREASWERGAMDSDRFRDRDRMRDSGNRDRNRDRFMDRGMRKDVREVKRPTTPPSPRKPRPHTPDMPPDSERMLSGPRTPKEEEPPDMFEERMDADNPHFFEREHTSAEHMYNLSEGEIQEENTEEDDGYEEIVSEEEDMSDADDRAIDMSEIDYDLGDETWNYMSSFSPYSCEFTPFQHFSDPSLFIFEVTEEKLKKEKSKLVCQEKQIEAEKCLELLQYPDGQVHDEKWVEVLERIDEHTLTGLLGLKCAEKLHDIKETLVTWVVEGLDFELALKQPQTAYKVRHLKAGIRLAILLFQTNEEIIRKMLEKDVPKVFLELINQPYMVLPVKLLILRGIDAVLSTKSGLDYIVNKKFVLNRPKDFDFNEIKTETDTQDESEKTCYHVLLDILVSKQLTRAVVSLSALIKKIHLYEILLEFSDSVEKVVQNTQLETRHAPSATNIPSPSESPESSEPRAASVEHEVDTLEAFSSIGEDLIQKLIVSLQEIATSYKTAYSDLAQTRRFLPARSQFEFPKSPYNPYPALLRIFKETNLLENIFVVLSSPALTAHPAVLLAVKDLILELLSSQEGMLFLLSVHNVINGLQRVLLHTVDEAREEGAEENIAQNLGMQIVYHLQALLYVDILMAYHAKEGVKRETDESEAVSTLHHMYTMVFSPIGRQAVVKVLTCSDNLNAVLPFVQVSGDEGNNAKLGKSVCAGYVTELLMLVVHYTEDVSFLEKFSDALHTLSQQENTPKLHDLGYWMSPTVGITSYTHEAVTPLMAILKTHSENAASLPPELITSLRILQHLAIPQSNDKNVELKYMHAIIQVFSNNGMEIFKTILQHICDTFLKPSHQSPALVGLQGVMVVAIVKPSIVMMKSILAYLISSRGTEFKDLTSVPVLLNVFSLILLVPPSSYSFNLAQMVQSDVIEALLTYTQPFLGTSESEEALSKSLWTEMVQEILKYTKLSPSNFMTGLTVLSELLPLPLPLQTREPLSEDEVVKMVNYRKLWSAHLHSLNGIIQEIIVSLAATSCHPLQQLLRRVCVQLTDLAAPTALFIVKAVLDALFDAIAVPPPEAKENLDPTVTVPPEKAPTLKAPNSTTSRILTLVAYLVSHASFKVPLMHLVKGSVKADERYVDVLPLMLELFNSPSDKPFVIQSQECIVSILQSLCDPDISFITFESGAPIGEVLSSSLPCKEQITQICGALVQHIGCHKHSYSSVLPSLRSLVMLTEHDYGYCHVKQGLDQHPGAVYSLFTRFSLSFSKDSSDCLSTLSTTLEFLRLMVNGFEDGPQTGRSILLSTSELAELLKADKSLVPNSDKDDKKNMLPFQPVVELEKQLTEFGNDEEAVESLLESISSLLTLLKSDSSVKIKREKDPVEAPVLPQPESQSSQFASRTVFMVGDVEEGRLSPAYWLAIPGAEDADQEQEQIPFDLVSLAEKNIPSEFNLKLSLESLCLSTEGEDDLKLKKKGISTIGGKRKYSPLINPAMVDMNNKRPFIAPMRGRGFSRANHSSRANDPFRSRPPNTSRPPSMHVDDFVALESHHGGGSNPQAKRLPKEGSRGRGGRGFDRNQIFPSSRGAGGRFFSPPGQYGRRDSNRDSFSSSGGRGTSRNLSNIPWSGRSNQSSGLKLPQGPRSNFGCHRSDYNSPFNQDTRPVGQRNREGYSDFCRPSTIIPLGRFSRGLRAGGDANQQGQGHWQDNRNKSQNQRFITPGTASRGGRRDMNTRHNRSFTR